MSTPVAPRFRTVITRTLRSIHPLVLLRSIAVTLVTVIATPLVAVVALYLVGIVVGDNLLSTGGQLVAQALVVNVLLFALAGLGLTVATLAVASVNADAHAGGDRMLRRALPRALSALPRLVVAQVLLAVATALGVLLWAPLTLAALVAALVLYVRARRTSDGAPHTPWIKRSLLLAIPFAPAAIALAVMVASVPASLSHPGSVTRLVRIAASIVRARVPAVVAFIVLVGAVTAGLTLVGSSVETMGAGDNEAVTSALLTSTLVLLVLLSAVIVVTGAAYAVLLPPTELRLHNDRGARPRAHFSGILTRRATKAASTAIVTIVALMATLVPTAAIADTIDPEATSVVEQPAAPEPVDPETLNPDLPPATFDTAVPEAAPAAAEPAAEPAVGPAAPAPVAARAAAPAAAAQAPAFATAVSAQFLNSGRLGEDQGVDVAVTSPDAPAGTEPTGTVEVYYDDLDPATTDVKISDLPLADAAYTFFVPTKALPAGDVTLRFVYVADNASFASSELSVVQHFDKADIQVTSVYTPASHEITFGQQSGVEFTIESGRDAAGLTVEVYRVGNVGFTLITTKTFSIVDGTATVPVDLTGALPVGQHQLYWDIPESANHAEIASEAPGFDVASNPTTTTLAVPPLNVGITETLRAGVTTPDGIIVDRGQVAFYADNVLIQRVNVVGGAAALSVTRDSVGDVTWRAEYFEKVSSPGFEASSDSETVTVGRIVPSREPVVWSGALTPEDTYLTATFIAWRGLPTPTGTVVVSTTGGTVIGSGTIVDGTVRIKADVISGVSQYRADYSGDAYWSDFQLFVPSLDVAAYKPVVTLTAPATATVDSSISLGVAVSGVPVELLDGVDLYRSYPGGETELIGAVDLKGGLSGRLSVTEAGTVPWGYIARARFTALSNVPNTFSEKKTVQWSLATPRLALTVNTPGEHAAGVPVAVTLTAAELPSGGAGIPTGTVAEIFGGGSINARVGAVTLTTDAAGGLSGTGTITHPLGGTGAITAYVTYGSLAQRAASVPVDLTFTPPRSGLSVGVENVVVGKTATVRVQLNPSGAAIGATPAQTVRVSFDGVERLIYLERPLFGGSLTGSYDFPVTRAGDFSVSAAVAGDGVYVGPTTRTIVASASKVQSTTTLLVRGTPASGQPLDVIPTVRATEQNLNLVAGGTVTVVAYPSMATCTVANDAVCTLPAGGIVAGENRITAKYSGDANFSWSDTATSVTGSDRASFITWGSSPTVENAVSDKPMTFTWKVTNASNLIASKGRVTVTLGDATCSADVTAGACTLTVPVQPGGISTEFLPVTLVFRSSDDASNVTAASAVRARDCLPVTVYNGKATPDRAADACERRGQAGFLSGSTVTVRPNPIAYPYAFAGWFVDAPGTATGDAFSFRVTKAHSASFNTKYSPVCFTLNVSPVIDNIRQNDPTFDSSVRGLLKGTAAATTSPNCRDPRNPTAEDMEEWASGRPRYAMGTEVYVRAQPLNATYEVDTINGVSKVYPNDTLYRTVMDRDKTVAATFKVAACVGLDIKPGDGGTISVVSATRPFDTRYLAPFSGACTTIAGGPGYVPGTVVTLRATPDSGLFFDAWRTTGFDKDPYGVDPLARRIVGDAPIRVSGADDARTMTYTVPSLKDGPLTVGASYSEVRCVAVTVAAQWPVGDAAFSALKYTNVKDSAPIDSLRCGPRSTAPKLGWKNAMFEQWTQTDWFVGTARVALEAPTTPGAFANDPITGEPTKRTIYPINSNLQWGVANPFALYKAGQGAQGPQLDLEFAANEKLDVTADWFATNCREVRATFPQGGKLEVRPVDGYQMCADGWAMMNQKIALWVAPQPGGAVIGVLSVPDPKINNPTSTWEDDHFGKFTSAADGRRYWAATNSDVTMPGPPSSTIRVEYCVPLALNVYVRNADGGADRQTTNGYFSKFSAIGDGGWADLVADNGGCPPLYTRPGASTEIGLTQLGAYGYTITNDSTGRGPTIAVDGQGSQTAAALYLSAKCYSVNRGDRVDADTEPNCPQDRSKYVAGTVVQLQADVRGGETFNGWSGTDATDDRYGWVAVGETDRSVSVDIHKPSTAQKVGNFFSSVAQRIIAVGATIATGIMLAHMWVVKGIAIVMSGVSSGLRALGVSGKDLDRFDVATAVVSAQTKTFEVFAGCVSKFAHGQKVTDHNVATQIAGAGAAKVAGLSTTQLQSFLKSRGSESLGEAAGVLKYGVDIVNAFASNPDMYFQDAAESWSNIGSSMSSCMENDIEAVMKPIIGD